MPIKIPEDLPAYSVLTEEGVMVLGEGAASRQDIRPLRIALLNLMPLKIQTETQFARLIGAGPLQIELSFIRMSGHMARNTSREHMEAFYRPFSELREERFDGLIITGAPVEHLDWQEVSYWEELEDIFNWTRSHVYATCAVCWGAMAMMRYFHGVEKHSLDHKAFGLFRHKNNHPSSPYLRGFSDNLLIPVSRWTELRQDEVDAADLTTLITSKDVGPCLIEDAAHRDLYMLNHLEYDSDTLAQEYFRDAEAGRPQLPVNYFPKDDPTRSPQNRWRSHAHLLFGNWINEIYQHTAFDVDEIAGPGGPQAVHAPLARRA